MFDGLTKGESFVFEWQYRYAGDFGRTLAMAFSLADTGNFARLSLGFPEEAEAMHNYMSTGGWWSELQTKCIKLGLLKR
jgi:hypothetical protein